MIDKEIARRDFLKMAGVTTAGLIVAIPIPSRRVHAKEMASDFSHIYLSVGEQEGDFTFVMDKAEMGQGVVTGQVTMFCEELDLDPAKLKVVPAPVKDVYGTLNGMQITGGSTSTPDRWETLRIAGANVRNAFVVAAAQKWGLDQSVLKVEDGFVMTADGSKRASYNELAKTAKVQDVENPKLKSADEFKYIGKYQQKVDAEEKSTGQAMFGIDTNLPGMLNAVVLRSPVFGGKVKSFDATQALKMPGIKKVFEISTGVAIVGEKYWQLTKARDAVKVEWDLGANEGLNSEDILKKYSELLDSGDGKEVHSEGEAAKVFEGEEGELLTVEYDLPYLAHSTMEPMNAVAHVTDDKCEIWTGTQGPTNVQNEAAHFLGLSRDDVTVYNAKYLGGGFGRRSTQDYPREAIEVAKVMKVPVKVTWSREDDTQFSPMRPISKHKLRAKVKGGKALAWEHKIGCESLMQEFLPAIMPHMVPGWMPKFLKNSVAGITGGVLDMFNVHMTTAEGAHHDYKMPNQYIGVVDQELDIPIHFWRSVGHSHNGFVKESFADEVAHAAKVDPYAFRREMLKDNPRGLAVLDKVAEMSKWLEPAEEGIFRGIAYHFSFGSYVAQVAEVSVEDDQLKVERVHCAIDCGVAINPNIVTDQIESSIVYGLSAALKGKIELKNGGVAQSNFHNYQVLRINEAPDIRVEIMPSTVAPMGVGEPGLPPIAAAVGNAIFAATGKRMRRMPFSLS
ncbi:MAG: xanthine dehydrogenase family protein molybdopterin-binding subunit [Bdellovibrionales bacterium]|nr:xanthine dehydrogenase family protein molybdopterin-binding subunit [Bdellovibrionales bacterium]